MAHRLTAICILVIAAAILATGLAIAQTAPAVEKLQRNCTAGVASSCAYLGVLYRHGKGVPRDYSRAIELQRKACARGSRFACGYVGDMTYLGLGTEENKPEGERVMRKACSAGDRWSCDAMRRHGLTPPEDSALALSGR